MVSGMFQRFLLASTGFWVAYIIFYKLLQASTSFQINPGAVLAGERVVPFLDGSLSIKSGL
jgi:hypothetical protein